MSSGQADFGDAFDFLHIHRWSIINFVHDEATHFLPLQSTQTIIVTFQLLLFPAMILF